MSLAWCVAAQVQTEKETERDRERMRMRETEKERAFRRAPPLEMFHFIAELTLSLFFRLIVPGSLLLLKYQTG
jgi:hypothetical protein